MNLNIEAVAGTHYADIKQTAPVEKMKTSANGKDAKVEEVNLLDQKGDKEIMDKAMEQANLALARENRYIEREIHKVTQAVMYRVRDTFTNEVIFEFPPKKMQDMIAKMWESAGLFVDKEG